MPNLTSAVRSASPTTRTPGSAPVRVTGLRKAFGTTPVLCDVELSVASGTILALLGPSGCGKTTLLRTIAGLERPDAGRIEVGDRVLADGDRLVPPEQRHVGMVFQDWALFPHLTVGRNVGFGLSRDERRSGRVDETLAMVDLDGFAQRMPSTLSGGQQQRVALARALATRPSVLLLDEPFSNLDSTLRIQIRVDVQRLLRDLHVTAIFVTHDQEEAFVMGDQVAVMLDGEVVQQAAPAQLYAAPASRAVAEFVGDANLIHGMASGGHADTPVGRVPLRDALHGPVEVLIRPEQLTLERGEECTIEAVEYYGHDAVYFLRAEGSANPAPLIRARVIDTPLFGAGDRVCVSYLGGPAPGYQAAAAHAASTPVIN